MREYVSEVRVKQRGGHFQFNIWNKKLKRFDEDEALLLMDGVPVFNTNKMIAFDPLKIMSRLGSQFIPNWDQK